MFQKTTPASIQQNQSTALFNSGQSKYFKSKSIKNLLNFLKNILAVRPVTSSSIQFVNTNSTNASNTVRPIIFHQKGTNNAAQPQLLTVMPAGVRVQQLTPVVRGTSTQPTTIVRLMSPATTTVRPGTTGQQQFIQLNTNKQQQPLVIKAISAQTSNRQQQPILLAANTQQKTIPAQSQQQVLVLNQNTFSTASGQQPKFTLQMKNIDQPNSTSVNTTTVAAPAPTLTTNNDNGQQESAMDTGIPQLDGCIDNDDYVDRRTAIIPQLDGTIDDQVNFLLFPS